VVVKITFEVVGSLFEELNPLSLEELETFNLEMMVAFK